MSTPSSRLYRGRATTAAGAAQRMRDQTAGVAHARAGVPAPGVGMAVSSSVPQARRREAAIPRANWTEAPRAQRRHPGLGPPAVNRLQRRLRDLQTFATAD